MDHEWPVYPRNAAEWPTSARLPSRQTAQKHKLLKRVVDRGFVFVLGVAERRRRLIVCGALRRRCTSLYSVADGRVNDLSMLVDGGPFVLRRGGHEEVGRGDLGDRCRLEI